MKIINQPFHEGEATRSGRHFFYALAAFAAALYLVVAIWSDTLSAVTHRDIIENTLEDNLAGPFGALLAYGIRASLGLLAFAIPLLLFDLAAKFLSATKPLRRTLIDTLCFLLTVSFLAAALGTSDTLRHAMGSRTGGIVGHSLSHLLSRPFGAVGALIFSLALAVAFSAVFIDYREVLSALARMGRGAGLLLLAAARRSGHAIRRAARVVAARRRSRREGDLLENTDLAAAREDGPENEADLALATLAADLGPLRGNDDDFAFFEERRPVSRPLFADILAERDDVTLDELSDAYATENDGTVSPLPAEPGPAPQPSSEASAPRVAVFSRKARVQRKPSWNVPATLFTECAEESASDRAEIDRMGDAVIKALAPFRIEGRLAGKTIGPSVVCYHVVPPEGLKISKMAELEEEIALSLRQAKVRIASLPRSGAIGVEMARPEPRTVRFREIYQAPAFRTGKHALPIALGLDLAGKPVVSDLAKMPHLLVAGATGSGKSVALNVILTSLCATHAPEDLRLILIDPKMVEMAPYQALPHLRHRTINEGPDAILALRWAEIEMERRYEVMAQEKCRNITDYEKKRLLQEAAGLEPGSALEKFPFIVIVVDELADLIMTADADLQKRLIKLAQKARAVGIHLILATQRPSKEILTGLLKANVPAKIAFRVASMVDSRVILDQNGAEQLLGNGDMLFMPPGSSDLTRIQGAYISTEETEAFVEWCAAERPNGVLRRAGEAPEDDILDIARRHAAEERAAAREEAEEIDGQERDEMYAKAVDLCRGNGSGSTSLLQRRLGIGYGRAARIVDQMIDDGLLETATKGSKARRFIGA